MKFLGAFQDDLDVRLGHRFAWNPAIVFVHLAVAFPPVVELAAAMSSHTINRPAQISVFSDQRRMKSTI